MFDYFKGEIMKINVINVSNYVKLFMPFELKTYINKKFFDTLLKECSLRRFTFAYICGGMVFMFSIAFLQYLYILW